MNLIGNINAIPFRRFRGGGGVSPFPSIPGMIVRYSASGLTNEQMAANPVWVDKTGNGHDLQMKNFAWGGMSGVGGYVEDYSIWVKSAVRADITFTDHSFNVTSVKINQVQFYYQSYGGEQPFTVPSYTVIVKGLTDGQVLEYIYTDIEGIHVFTVKNDGIYTLPSFEFIAKGTSYYGFRFNKVQESCNITIEQLPLYPDALVFDGVDDYGVCVNFPILTKEKGYTVVALRQWDQDFLNTTLTGGLLSTRNYSTGEGVAFEKIESSNKGYWNLGAGGIIDFAKSPFTWQTSKQYNNVGILKGNKNHGKPLCVGCGLSGGQQCGRFAIWELVFLDHDATEEELTKIKDYFVKTYPWLFPDQAWTVTGKTNEDKDRATIANITGNGNNLVLSNFGFAEGSGYGLYAYNFNSFNLKDSVVKPTDVKKDSFRIIGTGDNRNVLVLLNESDSADWKIRITGMKEGDCCLIGNANKSGNYISVTKDGIYTFQKQYAATSINGIWYNSSQEVDVLVEQIPEYEGYLVTDGVDDEVRSVPFTLNEDWTIVGDWELLSNVQISCGIVKVSSIFLYNSLDGVTIYFAKGPIKIQSKSINAFCSDGRIYLNDWTEILVPDVRAILDSRKSSLNIASYSDKFTKMAFKNLAIYDGKILSKDDCIKAYNYLQTLKAK